MIRRLSASTSVPLEKETLRGSQTDEGQNFCLNWEMNPWLYMSESATVSHPLTQQSVYAKSNNCSPATQCAELQYYRSYNPILTPFKPDMCISQRCQDKLSTTPRLVLSVAGLPIAEVLCAFW